ncbi:MAG: 2-oxo acid dehydrogenase subunit E2 [FCB group bacterium]|nr:2-oxo acid dehydrogenase subunit E2 [FCB group bacterium]
MIVDVIMPKMGESITEGTIIEWTKKPGDRILKDETLLEISTDKVDSEVPSPAAGRIIEILYHPNEVVAVDQIIARIDTTGKSPVVEPSARAQAVDTAAEAGGSSSETVLRETPEPQQRTGSRFFSPLVLSIAGKEHITKDELEQIPGTGTNGRVTKKDLLSYLEHRTAEKPASKNDTTGQVRATGTPVPTLTGKTEPMDRVRKRIAEHMRQSLDTSAHVYSTSEVDVTGMVTFRDQHKSEFELKYGVKLTYTPMILRACIDAIREFPWMNASLDGDNIIHHDHINLGVAVALPDDNLIVPVIKAAEEKSFIGLARATTDLAMRARTKKLQPDEIFGSTFSVTNPGVFGSLFGMAIINQPNVGILSVGEIHKRPVVKETPYGDMVVVRSMMYLTLSYDHRLIDGAYGTKFLSRIADLLGNFDGTDIL